MTNIIQHFDEIKKESLHVQNINKKNMIRFDDRGFVDVSLNLTSLSFR